MHVHLLAEGKRVQKQLVMHNTTENLKLRKNIQHRRNGSEIIQNSV